MGGDGARGPLESWSRDAPGRRGCREPGQGRGSGVENRMSSEDSPSSLLVYKFFKFYFFGCTGSSLLHAGFP